VGGTLVFAAATMWLLSGSLMRMLSAIAIVVFTRHAVAFVFGRGHRPLILSGIVVAALLLSPLEVSPIGRFGWPGIVPLMMGLPTPALLKRAERGEVVLGDCGTTGLEPRWVVVW
jgi:hypothetical protein